MNPQIEAYAAAVAPVAKVEFTNFIREVGPDAAGVTHDQIGAIWRNAQYVSRVLPLLPDDPTPEQVLVCERLILQDAKDLEVISQLEVQDAEKIARIKAKALKYAQTIGATAAAGLLVSLSNSIPK